MGMRENSYEEQSKILAVMANDITYIKQDIKDIKVRLDADYVSREEFAAEGERNELVRKIVFGLVSMVMVGFMGAVIALVIR